MSETEKYRYHLTYMWNLNKKQNKTKHQAPRFREHISGCQRLVRVKWVKGVKRHKLLVCIWWQRLTKLNRGNYFTDYIMFYYVVHLKLI